MKKISFLAIIILGNCASLSTVGSIEESLAEANLFSYNDLESKVFYYVANDTNNLYVSLNTSETTSIAKILKTRLTVYLDVDENMSTMTTPIKFCFKVDLQDAE
jgi:hypothetical protein